MDAASAGKIEAVKLLLSNKDIDVTRCDNFGQNVLFYGASSPEMLRILLADQRILAMINNLDSFGSSALACTPASSGDIECISILMEAGADPALKGGSGISAIEKATHQEHKSAVLLMTSGVSKVYRPSLSTGSPVNGLQEDFPNPKNK